MQVFGIINMKNKIELLVLAIVCISLPLIALTCMSAVIWALTGLSFGFSFLVSTSLAFASGYYLYSALRREVREFDIKIEFDDEEDDIL